MPNNAIIEILSNIIATTFGRHVDYKISLSAQLPNGSRDKLCDRINEELELSVPKEEFDALTLPQLSELVESAFRRNRSEQSLADIYVKLKKVASDAVYHDINYTWFSFWEGDILKESDSLERVEVISRMEEEFEVSIPDQDVSSLQTVGQTVRYLWRLTN